MAELISGLFEKVGSKVHTMYVNEIKEGEVKCTKPTGEVYGIRINGLKDLIDSGRIVILSEDQKKMTIQFEWKQQKSVWS